MSRLERLLRHDGAITILGLLALCALTWAYLVSGAGLGMSAWDMTLQAVFPRPHSISAPSAMAAMADMADMAGMDMGSTASAWDLRHWVLIIAMWWAMMIAMMAPSAAPAILLHARVRRHAQSQGPDQTQAQAWHASSAVFTAGYLLAWLLFSIIAAMLHYALERTAILSAATMGSQVRWVSGAVLVAAGLYQLSPLKNACLSHCRAPAAFLARHWRPHALGTLRLGAMHGAYCIGCCWMLMTLLFVGGVMNLAWIAALTLLVLAEKLLPAGLWVSRVAAIVLIGWGAAILLM